MIKISTSILSSSDRIKCIKTLNSTNTNYIHIDAMDNKFVPNYQLPPEEINELSKYSKKKFDIHLMVEKPIEYIKKIKCKNIINNITFHIEVNDNIGNIINFIKTRGDKVGIAINPDTPLDSLDKYLDRIDIVLIMGVNPGFGGQKFIPDTTKKMKELRKRNKRITIEVDGGIDNNTINEVKEICDIVTSGSYITGSDNYQKAINDLKN